MTTNGGTTGDDAEVGSEAAPDPTQGTAPQEANVREAEGGDDAGSTEHERDVHEHGEAEPKTPEAILRREMLGHLLEHWYAQDDILRVAQLSTRYEKAVGDAREATSNAFVENAGDIGEALGAAAELLEHRDDLTDNERRYVMASALREHAPYESTHRQHSGYSARAFTRVRDRRKNLGLLSAQLIALVADFELFVLRATTSWLAFNSDHLSDRSKQLSYREISQYDSLEELQESIVNSFLEEHMRKSATVWFDEFCKLFGVQKISGADEYVTLEAFQRRHVIVHHGGVVSRQYLANLKKFKPKVALGDDLHVDRQYIRDAATALASVAHSIVMTALMTSTTKSPEERKFVEHEAGELTYILLTLNRARVVENFSAHFDLSRVKYGWSREQLRVNGWIAKRRLKKIDQCLPQIEAWDVSGLHEQFQLAKKVLLGENAAVVTQAVRMVRDRRLSAYSVASWPLFEGVRREIFEALEPAPVEESRAVEQHPDSPGAIEQEEPVAAEPSSPATETPEEARD